MVLGLLGAFGAALCYGVASVLQAVSARREATAEGLDPRLFLRLLKSWPYLAGLALDGFAFLLSVAALRSLPLFVVQAIVASFLAVTAVLGAIVLKMPLRRADWIGLGVVILGLVMLALSAAKEDPVDISSAAHWGLLAAAIVLGVAAIPLARIKGSLGAAALGAIAGLSFGITSIGARILPELWPPRELLGNPATYAMAVAAVVALLTYATALQRGSVTQATAPLVVGETLGPAAVGLFLLGDKPREGWGWVAALGFALSVAGALALARHGEVEKSTATNEGTDVADVTESR